MSKATKGRKLKEETKLKIGKAIRLFYRKVMEERVKRQEYVECACGCGQILEKFECDPKHSHYRPRRFIGGHQTRLYKPSCTLEARRKNSISKLGDKNPMKRPEVRKKSSLSHMGKSSARKGVKLSEELIIKILKTQLMRNISPTHYTCLEQIYREYLLRIGFVEAVDFYHNFRIGRYVVDFLIPREKLVVEIDGPTHKFESDKLKRIIRDAYIQKLNFKIVHYDVEETKQFKDVNVWKLNLAAEAILTIDPI